MTYEELYNKAIQTKTKYETLNSQLNQAKENRESLIKKLKESKNMEIRYENAITILKEMIDTLSRAHIDYIEELLNTSVQTIFYDRDYSIEFEISEYRNSNVLKIYLIERTEDRGVIRTELKDNGFGLKTIVGFVLQIYFIIYHKQAPILWMDEALTALSKQYIPYLKSLIQRLSEKYHFRFILVAHDEKFIDLADRIYEVEDGKVTWKI